ncbi:alpha-L-fucosidase-like [Onthophagus taurus]|uniref:alpha-L-fucosidase-like n=1 Tax=Onthophagus taurus TaxID=166361 RepID=UPI0039BDDC3F
MELSLPPKKELAYNEKSELSIRNTFEGKYINIERTYEPTWESLDTRPLPEWYDKAKVGIFVHWGVYSVPSFGSEWFWINWKGRNISKYEEFMEKNYPPGFQYQEFARDFTAEFYEPEEWAKLFKESGAKYVVLTSKHHEGYTLWPSKQSFSWNSMDVGPHRDLLGELSKAVKSEGLHFGIYHSLMEWFNPRYLSDKETGFLTSEYVENKVLPELKEVITTYEPDIVWSDGEWEAQYTYWKSTDFLAWLYNESPVKENVVANDRWGSEILCKHGDFYTCADRFNPGVLQTHKWENCMTIDRYSWGYRRNANFEDYMTAYELIKTMVETVSCGGNILINVGPTKEGTIIPVFQERLMQLGAWLKVNGEAIYDSVPWKKQNDTLHQTWYTSNDMGDTVYAISLIWPTGNVIQLASADELFANSTTTVQLLGNNGNLAWTKTVDAVSIVLPDKSSVKVEYAWVLKISNFS